MKANLVVFGRWEYEYRMSVAPGSAYHPVRKDDSYKFAE